MLSRQLAKFRRTPPPRCFSKGLSGMTLVPALLCPPFGRCGAAGSCVTGSWGRRCWQRPPGSPGSSSGCGCGAGPAGKQPRCRVTSASRFCAAMTSPSSERRGPAEPDGAVTSRQRRAHISIMALKGGKALRLSALALVMGGEGEMRIYTCLCS